MKSLFLTALVCSFSAFASNENEVKVASEDDAHCHLINYGEYQNSTGKCFYGDVMVGISSLDPLTIRCSRLDVHCHRKDEKVADKKVEKQD